MVRKNIFLVVLGSALIALNTANVSAQTVDSDPFAAKKTCDCAPVVKESPWATNLGLGLNVTSGNSETTLLTTLLNVGYEKDAHIFRWDSDFSFGEQENKEGEKETTQQNANSKMSHLFLFKERVYVTENIDFAYDEVADLSYRTTPAVGLGYFFLKDENTRFGVDAGPAYVFERLGGDDRNYAAARLSERFDWKISEGSRWYEVVRYIIAVDDADQYRVEAETGLTAAIVKGISLFVTLKDTYVNEAAVGKKQNDLALISGLQFAW